MKELNSEDKAYLLGTLRNIPDFPKPGINFKDITTLLNDAKAFRFLMDHLEARYQEMDIDFVAGIDSRGFIFGAALADRLGKGFVPIRKQGKLPYTTIGQKYALEYGFDEIEVHIDAFKTNKEKANVLLIDDLIATGGTATAAAHLINQTGAHCIEACFLINLTFLHGDTELKKHAPVYSILEIN